MNPARIPACFSCTADRHGTPSPDCVDGLSADAGRRVATPLRRAVAALFAGCRAASAAEQYLAGAADAQDLQVRLHALERARP